MYWVWGQIGQKRCFKAFNIAFNANIATTGINTGIDTGIDTGIIPTFQR